MSRGINLLKTKEMRVTTAEGRYVQLRIVAIGLLFLISSFSIVLFILIAFSPLPQLQRQEQEAKAVLAAFHQDMAKILFVNQRTNLANTIIIKRKSYSQLIGTLDAKIPNGVEVVELKVDEKKTLLSASSKSLHLLEELLSTIIRSVQDKKDFSQITLKSLSFERGTDKFVVIIQLFNL